MTDKDHLPHPNIVDCLRGVIKVKSGSDLAADAATNDATTNDGAVEDTSSDGEDGEETAEALDRLNIGEEYQIPNDARLLGIWTCVLRKGSAGRDIIDCDVNCDIKCWCVGYKCKFVVISTRLVGKPEGGSAMYFWLILIIFSGVNTNLEVGVRGTRGGLTPPPPTNRAPVVINGT